MNTCFGYFPFSHLWLKTYNSKCGLTVLDPDKELCAMQFMCLPAQLASQKLFLTKTIEWKISNRVCIDHVGTLKFSSHAFEPGT
jgi:hypothetical protein